MVQLASAIPDNAWERAAREAEDATLRPYGLLIVDDEEGVRSLLAVAMLAQGFRVWVAPERESAIAIYREFESAIDIVLLDVAMPGHDGPDVLESLREIDPQLHFCFMSANIGKYSAENLLGLGARGLFKKPFQLGELARRLRRVARPILKMRQGDYTLADQAFLV